MPVMDTAKRPDQATHRGPRRAAVPPRAEARAVTFGLEEEFVLLDPDTLRTVDLGVRAVDALRGSCPGAVVREFFPSQIEFATPVCTDADEAFAAVAGFRRRLAGWAAAAGVVAAGAGTPFATSGRVPRWQGRYADIAADIGALAADHQLNGLHVHVGIADRDAAVRASNFLRSWLPVLLALSANSPFWQAGDTGFASWRVIHSRRWTTHGIPPHFADAADYDGALARLTGVGATSDAGTVNWHVRLSAAWPTLEVRVCDAQLDPQSSVALAVLIRALVVAGVERETAPPTGVEVWDAALWHAARHGLTGALVDPGSGRLVPAATAIAALVAAVGWCLGPVDRRIVDRFLADVRRFGGGAARQREAYARGRLGELYREQLIDAHGGVDGHGGAAAHGGAGVVR